MFRSTFFLLSLLLLIACDENKPAQQNQAQPEAEKPANSTSVISQEPPAALMDKGTAFLTEMDAFVAREDYEGAKVEADQAAYYLRKAVTVDPNFSAAAAPALARAYYYQSSFKEALDWYQQASDADPSNPVLFKMKAMTHFNIGNIADGQKDVAQSINLDGSEENREAIVNEMLRISVISFDFGAAYIEDGYPQKGTDYQKYGLAIHRLAFDLAGHEHKDIARQIVNWAIYLKDQEVVDLYQEFIK